MKFKKGDEIVITGGKDRGKRGKIERVFPQEDRVVVPGLNSYKRHVKRRDEKNPGGIFDMPRPLPVANIAIVCPNCNKPTRIGYEVGKNGDKHRVCRKCKKIISN